MKKYILLIPILISISFIGCATNQDRPQYIWKDYSSSLYATKKTPSDTNTTRHKELLLSIIEESKAKNYKVPPGVYCECGYILLKEGKREDALRYFDLEAQAYPESSVFVQNLKTYVAKSSKKDDNEGGRGPSDNGNPINTESK
jgi:hypothetical protein